MHSNIKHSKTMKKGSVAIFSTSQYCASKRRKNRQIENQKENNSLYIPWNVNFKGCFFFCNHLWITPPKLMQLHDRTTYTKLIHCPYFVCNSNILFCQETIDVFRITSQLNRVKY